MPICFRPGIVPLSYAIGSIVLIAAGEILIGPTIYAAASEAAPKNHVGLTMSLVTVGFACANLVSGWISQTMAIADSVSSIDVYANGFYTIGLASLALALGIIIANKKIRILTT
jgi:dipeptide/tripeptide permease